MGKHKRERSTSREDKKRKKKKKKHQSSSSSPEVKSRKRSRSSSSLSDDSHCHRKSSKSKKSKKHKKEKLPSIDNLISKKVKDQKHSTSIGEDTQSVPTKSMIPMTKEQYDEKQSVVRRVYDEDTGRMRLVKGDGEIIEEIVSASRQKEINKMATKGDGESFQASLNSHLRK